MYGALHRQFLLVLPSTSYSFSSCGTICNSLGSDLHCLQFLSHMPMNCIRCHES
uniref:Uncharacterized protein n=1 Tax=Arundo donax TaxID=35708 RepID=A0A0A8XW44_ARUDO